MDKGYIENGFIVDVSNANKTSEIIYELSRILDLPDAQSKRVCLKLGTVDLTPTELTSIKALVESMNSEIEFVTTSSDVTMKSAEDLNIEVSDDEVNGELEKLAEAYKMEIDKVKELMGNREMEAIKMDIAVQKPVDFVTDAAVEA